MAFVRKGSTWCVRQGGQEWALQDWAKTQTNPFYFYDLNDAVERAAKFKQSGFSIHYAMKSNSHPRLLKLFAEQGLGVDVVSLGEMNKALECGFAPEKIIFSGVGKGVRELEAALAKKILQINVESFSELQLLNELCKKHRQKAVVALRLNIHLPTPTHKNIQTATEESKFGLDVRQLPELLIWLKSHPDVQLKSLAVHIGSQITEADVFRRMSEKMVEIFSSVKAQGFDLQRLDLGGGLGMDYTADGAADEALLAPYFQALQPAQKTGAQIVLEPGRFLVARMGVLLAQVVHVKPGLNRDFVILNAGMNCLMRPALYQAYHRIEPLQAQSSKPHIYTIVGPICESTDVFAEDRSIPEVQAGDWVGIFDTGAYGFVMANTYNEMPLPEQWTLLDGKLEKT